MPSGFVVKTIPLTRMDCPTCIPLLEREVKQLEGVDKVQGNYMNKSLRVTYDPDVVRLGEIEAAIERVGYRITYKKYPSFLSKLKGFLKREDESLIASLTDTEFSENVLQTLVPAVVLFSSPSCPACHFFKRQLQEIAQEFEKVNFFEMDIASSSTWREFDMLSIPTVLIFRDGQLVKRFDAMPQEKEIKIALESQVGNDDVK
ncbi:MAG: thioredoxin domain-containing protein [Candidatus Bathyarchaeota archaeon]